VEFNCVLAERQLIERVPCGDGKPVVGVVELVAGGLWFLLLFRSKIGNGAGSHGLRELHDTLLQVFRLIVRDLEIASTTRLET
jgi:hypothetical protein